MAQSGYTPISLYYSTTAAATPTAGNLVNGELAINITDGKLYYKDNSGVVKLLAGSTSGPAGGSNTQVQFNSSGVLSGSSSLTWDGTYLTAGSIKDSALTSGRVTYAGASGLLSDSASLTWDGTTLAATKFSGALNGTVGATTPSTGAFTTLSATAGVQSNRTTGTAYYATADAGYGLFDGVANSSGGRFTVTGNSTGNGINAYAFSYNQAAYEPFNVIGTTVNIKPAGSTVGAFSSTGLAVTGTLSATGAVTLSGGTANGVAYLDGSKVLTTGSALTFDGTNLGLGGTTNSYGSQTAFTLSGANVSRIDFRSNSTFTGTILSYQSVTEGLRIQTEAGYPISFYPAGTLRGSFSAAGQFSTTLDAAIYGITVGRGAGAVATNTAVGASALAANTTGAFAIAIGSGALQSNTTGDRNTAIGYQSIYTNISGNYNVGVGFGTLNQSTGSNNTAVGYYTGGIGNLSGNDNTLYGFQAGLSNTSGASNTAVGSNALNANTTGANNTSVGFQSLLNNTTASKNTAVGYQAGYSNTTGTANAFFGRQAGYSMTAGDSTLIGDYAGQATTGASNTFVGSGAGYLVTTGGRNTIIGRFGGNSGGLDIRTASNYIVLSDGDGNPRGIFDGSGNLLVGTTSGNAGIQAKPNSGNCFVTIDHITGTASGEKYQWFFYNGSSIGSITQNGTTAVAYNTSSDYRLKHDIAPMTGALAKVAALKPVTYKWNSDGSDGEGFIAHELAEVVPQCVTGEKDAVDAEGNPVYQGIDTSFLVATLTAAIQELKAEVDSLKSQLKGA